MQNGLLFSCQPSLIESWWTCLKDRGFCVEFDTPLSIEVPPERNGVHYRSGIVRSKNKAVRVEACPGPYAPSTSPLCGKHILVLAFRASSKDDMELARVIGDLLVEFGAHEIPAPVEPP